MAAKKKNSSGIGRIFSLSLNEAISSKKVGLSSFEKSSSTSPNSDKSETTHVEEKCASSETWCSDLDDQIQNDQGFFKEKIIKSISHKVKTTGGENGAHSAPQECPRWSRPKLQKRKPVNTPENKTKFSQPVCSDGSDNLQVFQSTKVQSEQDNLSNPHFVSSAADQKPFQKNEQSVLHASKTQQPYDLSHDNVHQKKTDDQPKYSLTPQASSCARKDKCDAEMSSDSKTHELKNNRSRRRQSHLKAFKDLQDHATRTENNGNKSKFFRSDIPPRFRNVPTPKDQTSFKQVTDHSSAKWSSECKINCTKIAHSRLQSVSGSLSSRQCETRKYPFSSKWEKPSGMSTRLNRAGKSQERKQKSESAANEIHTNVPPVETSINSWICEESWENESDNGKMESSLKQTSGENAQHISDQKSNTTLQTVTFKMDSSKITAASIKSEQTFSNDDTDDWDCQVPLSVSQTIQKNMLFEDPGTELSCKNKEPCEAKVEQKKPQLKSTTSVSSIQNSSEQLNTEPLQRNSDMSSNADKFEVDVRSEINRDASKLNSSVNLVASVSPENVLRSVFCSDGKDSSPSSENKTETRTDNLKDSAGKMDLLLYQSSNLAKARQASVTTRMRGNHRVKSHFCRMDILETNEKYKTENEGNVQSEMSVRADKTSIVDVATVKNDAEEKRSSKSFSIGKNSGVVSDKKNEDSDHKQHNNNNGCSNDSGSSPLEQDISVSEKTNILKSVENHQHFATFQIQKCSKMDSSTDHYNTELLESCDHAKIKKSKSSMSSSNTTFLPIECPSHNPSISSATSFTSVSSDDLRDNVPRGPKLSKHQDKSTTKLSKTQNISHAQKHSVSDESETWENTDIERLHLPTRCIATGTEKTEDSYVSKSSNCHRKPSSGSDLKGQNKIRKVHLLPDGRFVSDAEKQELLLSADTDRMPMKTTSHRNSQVPSSFSLNDSDTPDSQGLLSQVSDKKIGENARSKATFSNSFDKPTRTEPKRKILAMNQLRCRSPGTDQTGRASHESSTETVRESKQDAADDQADYAESVCSLDVNWDSDFQSLNPTDSSESTRSYYRDQQQAGLKSSTANNVIEYDDVQAEQLQSYDHQAVRKKTRSRRHRPDSNSYRLHSVGGGVTVNSETYKEPRGTRDRKSDESVFSGDGISGCEFSLPSVISMDKETAGETAAEEKPVCCPTPRLKELQDSSYSIQSTSGSEYSDSFSVRSDSFSTGSDIYWQERNSFDNSKYRNSVDENRKIEKCQKQNSEKHFYPVTGNADAGKVCSRYCNSSELPCMSTAKKSVDCDTYKLTKKMTSVPKYYLKEREVVKNKHASSACEHQEQRHEPSAGVLPHHHKATRGYMPRESEKDLRQTSTNERKMHIQSNTRVTRMHRELGDNSSAYYQSHEHPHARLSRKPHMPSNDTSCCCNECNKSFPDANCTKTQTSSSSDCNVEVISQSDYDLPAGKHRKSTLTEVDRNRKDKCQGFSRQAYNEAWSDWYRNSSYYPPYSQSSQLPYHPDVGDRWAPPPLPYYEQWYNAWVAYSMDYYGYLQDQDPALGDKDERYGQSYSCSSVCHQHVRPPSRPPSSQPSSRPPSRPPSSLDKAHEDNASYHEVYSGQPDNHSLYQQFSRDRRHNVNTSHSLDSETTHYPHNSFQPVNSSECQQEYVRSQSRESPTCNDGVSSKTKRQMCMANNKEDPGSYNLSENSRSETASETRNEQSITMKHDLSLRGEASTMNCNMPPGPPMHPTNLPWFPCHAGPANLVHGPDVGQHMDYHWPLPPYAFPLRYPRPMLEPYRFNVPAEYRPCSPPTSTTTSTYNDKAGWPGDNPPQEQQTFAYTPTRHFPPADTTAQDSLRNRSQQPTPLQPTSPQNGPYPGVQESPVAGCGIEASPQEQCGLDSSFDTRGDYDASSSEQETDWGAEADNSSRKTPGHVDGFFHKFVAAQKERYMQMYKDSGSDDFDGCSLPSTGQSTSSISHHLPDNGSPAAGGAPKGRGNVGRGLQYTLQRRPIPTRQHFNKSSPPILRNLNSMSESGVSPGTKPALLPIPSPMSYAQAASSSSCPSRSDLTYNYHPALSAVPSPVTPVCGSVSYASPTSNSSGERSSSAEKEDGTCKTYFRKKLSLPVDKSNSFNGSVRRGMSSYASRLLSDNRLSGFSKWDSGLKGAFSKTYHTRFIDTHCHIDFLFNREPYNGTFTEYRILKENSFPSNYEGCVAVFCRPRTFTSESKWKPIVEESGVWMAMGCHPKNATEYTDWTELGLRQALKHKKTVALGEIGLDYSKHHGQFAAQQKQVFIRQIQIALEMKLPLVIHCREAEDDCLDIMEEHIPADHKIHCHCFTTDYKSALRWTSRFSNLFIGLTPLVTFRSAVDTHQVARLLPLNKLLLETDAPYFLPNGFDGGDNSLSHPGMALTVAIRVAELRGIDVEEVLAHVRQNTTAMYGI